MKPRFAVALVALGLSGLVVTSTVGLWPSGSRERGAFSSTRPCAPETPRGQLVQVTLHDRGTMMASSIPMGVALVVQPATVLAGPVTFVANNGGRLTHELLVMPAPDTGVGCRPVNSKGTIDETASLGEASDSCGAGVGSGIQPGTAGWVTMTLQPGLYELLCDVPWHYERGMVAEFRVY